MIAALRHTDLCSLAMPTNGEQRQGEREPFIITQERRGKCSAGKGEENTGIMLPVASRTPHRDVFSRLLPCFIFVYLWIQRGFFVN